MIRKPPMRELSLFSGAAGGLLATKHLLGWETVGYVENNEYCQEVLKARIRDGLLDDAPGFGDIRQLIADGYAEAYQGLVDVITGGFPCQPFSCAGKRAGEDDARNMWPSTIAAIRIIRPRFVFLENVPGLTAREKLCLLVVEKIRQLNFLNTLFPQSITGPINRIIVKAFGRSYFARILGDLAESGYDARWRVLSAAEVGAPHLRKRLWIVGYASRSNIVADASGRNARESEAGNGRKGFGGRGEDVADAEGIAIGSGLRKGEQAEQWRRRSGDGCGEIPNPDKQYDDEPGHGASQDGGEQQGPAGILSGREWWLSEPDVGRMVDGVAGELDFSWPPEPEGVPRVAQGVPNRAGRLTAIGNGQVPLVAATALRLLTGE